MWKKLIMSCVCLVMFSSTIQSQDMQYSREPLKGALITGTCLLAMPVVISLLASSMAGYGYESVIPVVGPLILMGKEEPSTPGGLVYTGLSIAEAIGTALIIRGIIGKKKPMPLSVSPHIYRKGFGCRLSFNLSE
jgi:hypothetical protein